MLRLVLALAVAVSLVACGGERDERSGDPPAAEPATPLTADAGAPPPPPETLADGGVTVLPSYDPASGFHLDDLPPTRPSTRIPARDRKHLQILIRSTPSGASAAVDGNVVGRTPVLWEGVLDGQPHEFTLSLAGHTAVRYRFVPVTSGIVHGTLVKLAGVRDAGVP